VLVMRKHGRTPSIRHLVPAAFVLGLVLPAGIAALAALAALAFHSAGSRLVAVLALVLLGAGLVSYLAVLLVASITTARRFGWDLLPILPLTFATYHVSYGIGFLQGLVDFGMRRRKTAPSIMSQLTR
jgi:hypothetical protein